MDKLTNDVLFYNICYSNYEVATIFSSLSKHLNKLSKGYNGESRNIINYFLIPIYNKNGDCIEKYFINKITKLREGVYLKYTLENDVLPIIQCTFKNGKLYGKYKEWHNKSRHLKKECTYVDSVLEGELKEWYEDGTLRIHANYLNGQLHGECKQWNDNGNQNNKWIHDVKPNKEETEYRDKCMKPLCSFQVFLHYFHKNIGPVQLEIELLSNERYMTENLSN
ncbi:MORN-repeat protein [Orpheovirus IHUMI-LCC2]|uniref:MORN-repeat protein n=1 Tax=Orpheovirus IHUMI-LCC2 TaxID=2023057 RepID=A0A2I2L4K5_9VIRU|nr:MORN-repeat protein [Orpheovirus IHUMI-LCC2]SNW62463.1 MORN-repeat protein [Orpheovirus IHUMI-LCC2]